MVVPNEAVFQEYIDIVLDGDYQQGRGWAGRWGYFFGGMQIQGICAYYYGERHPEMGLELDRCKINAMVDDPLFRSKETGIRRYQCRDGRSSCEDCRRTELEEILSAHFTICGKPWECHQSSKLCMKLHTEWFRVRRNFEETRSDVANRQLPKLEDTFMPEIFFGYCKVPGRGGYLPIQV